MGRRLQRVADRRQVGEWPQAHALCGDRPGASAGIAVAQRSASAGAQASPGAQATAAATATSTATTTTAAVSPATSGASSQPTNGAVGHAQSAAGAARAAPLPLAARVAVRGGAPVLRRGYARPRGLLPASHLDGATARQAVSDDPKKPEKEPPQQPDDYDATDDFARSIDEAYRVIRERKANGGKGWTPP